MARGESPYQGRYVVPDVDFSGIERAGAAWGEAFKGIGEQVEKYQLKKQERGVLEDRLTGMVRGIAESNPKGLVELFGVKTGQEFIEKGIAGNATVADLQGMIGQLVGYQDVRGKAIERAAAEAQLTALRTEAARVQQEKTWSLDMADVHDIAKIQASGLVDDSLDMRDSQVAELKNQLGAAKKLGEVFDHPDDLKAAEDIKSQIEELNQYTRDDALEDAIRALPEDRRFALTQDREWWSSGRGKMPNRAERIAAIGDTTKAVRTLKKSDITAETVTPEEEVELETAAWRAGLEGEVSDANLKKLNVKLERANVDLKGLEVDAKKALAKMNEEHPAGELFAHTLDSGVKVYVMWTGQTFQVVPTGELTEADTYKGMFSIFGDKIAKYYGDTRNPETGEIKAWDELDPSMELALIKLLTDRGAEAPQGRFVTTKEWNHIKDMDEDQRATWNNKGRPMPKEAKPKKGESKEAEPDVKEFKDSLKEILNKG